MVDKKNFKKELSSLNNELNEILTKENFKIPQDYLYKDNEQHSSSNFKEFEILSMIKDVREEINLLRRNMFNDLESFVNKKINSQQEKFFEKIEQSVSKLLRESMISRSQHISELKSEFSNFHMKINKIEEEIDNLKNLSVNTKSISQEIQTYQFELENSFNNKLSDLEHSLISRFIEISHSLSSKTNNLENNNTKKLPSPPNKNNFLENKNQGETQTYKLSSKVENRISRIDAALRKLEQ